MSNGTNGHAYPAAGPRVTFADVFGKMPSAPAPAIADAQSANPQTVTPAPSPAPAAPTATPPQERSGNRSFADMAAYVATNVGVAVISDRIRKGGREPREVAQEDIDKATESTADAIVRGMGDMEVPWWAALATAWGNLYLAMRVGAKPLKPGEREAITTSSPEPTNTTTSSPPPSPLGQVVQPRMQRPHNPTAMPPEIPVSA